MRAAKGAGAARNVRRPRRPAAAAPASARGSRRRRRPRRPWLLLLALGLVVLVLPPAALLVWAQRAGPGGNAVVKTHWAGGESAQETAERLAELGLVASPRLFAWYFGWFASGVSVQPGPHLLRYGLSPRELVQRLGRVPSRERVRVTVPEGYTHLQIAARLEEKQVCEAAALRAATRDRRLLDALGVRAESAEGYLFPATYELFVDADPLQAVRQMVGEMRKRLARIDAELGNPMARLAVERGWGEHEVLTLASLIEKEARFSDEQPLIASVFFNRLDDATFRPAKTLQSDASAAYGCQVFPELAPSCASYRGRVTPEMLRDPANPYNTYRHPGLPKGPIGNPGEGAIRAALAPAKTDYLFFVADGQGRHRFSRTFEEHRRAITRPAKTD